jgi:hypothetical protein
MLHGVVPALPTVVQLRSNACRCLRSLLIVQELRRDWCKYWLYRNFLDVPVTYRFQLLDA